MCAASALFQNLYKSQGTGPLKIEDLTTIYILNESQATSTFKCLHQLDSCSKAKAVWAPRPEPRPASPCHLGQTKFNSLLPGPGLHIVAWICLEHHPFPVLASFTALLSKVCYTEAVLVFI